jgi:pseudouridylate synthase
MNGLNATSPLVVGEEVRSALDDGAAVVALESNVGSTPEAAAAARAAEDAVRAAGAVPATIGIVDGQIRVGMDYSTLERLCRSAEPTRKLGPRDIAACIAQRAHGVTTIGSTLAIAELVGIRFMATSGLGGVHRGYAERPDISADLGELTRTSIFVVAAGVKAILDVPATAEILEALSVPVLGWRTDSLPLYYTAAGGPPVVARVETAEEAAQIAFHHWHTVQRRGSIVLGQPPSEDMDDVEGFIVEALDAAEREGVAGPDITPYVLGIVHKRSGGRTAAAGRRLMIENSTLAADIAVAYTGL